MTIEDLEGEITILLRRAGQRFTSGRRRLVTALHESDGPVTITQILAADADLTQSSVYRNLVILEQAGVVTRVVTHDDFARYELAEQLTEHHHHLICSNCGDVADFSLDHKTEANLDKALQQIAGQAGFTADNHRLDLLGVCAECD